MERLKGGHGCCCFFLVGGEEGIGGEVWGCVSQYCYCSIVGYLGEYEVKYSSEVGVGLNIMQCQMF